MIIEFHNYISFEVYEEYKMDELDKIILTFLLNLVLLGIGYLLTKNTVNRYQKNKENMEIRDILGQIFCETNDKFYQISRTWNKLLEEITSVTDKGELRLLSKNPIVDEFIRSFHEFKTNQNLLMVRSTVYLESNIKYANLLKEYSSKVLVLGRIMEGVIDNPSKILELDDKNNPRILLKEIGEFSNKILTFLFTAEIKN